MHETLKHFLMYGSIIALVGLTACGSLDASVAYDGNSEGASATQARSAELLQEMDRDSQAGGE
jgi:hypothetical protein